MSKKFKHTPGPWQSLERMCDEGAPPYAPVVADTLIAKVYSTYFGDNEQALANASLIAAAPDLLTALIAADIFIDIAVEYLCLRPCPPALDTIRITVKDAIAKATGGSDA